MDTGHAARRAVSRRRTGIQRNLAERRPRGGHPELRDLAEKTEAQLDAHFGGDRAFRETLASNPSNGFDIVQALFLSDTIVFATAFKDYDRLKRALRYKGDDDDLRTSFNAATIDTSAAAIGRLVVDAIAAVSHLAFAAPSRSPTLPSTRSTRRFLVGPAVDDAVEHASTRTRFFRLADSCEALNAVGFAGPSATLHGRLRTGNLLPHRVPLRGGVELETLAVNPFCGCETEMECTRSRIAFFVPFRDPPSTCSSRSRTQRASGTSLETNGLRSRGRADSGDWSKCKAVGPGGLAPLWRPANRVAIQGARTRGARPERSPAPENETGRRGLGCRRG